MTLTVTKNSPQSSQAERAYWLLVERIINLELPPGAVLMDRELTRELDVGRTPMREALQRLAVEDLVVHYPNRGMVVSEISARSTRDIYEFRALIDGEAAKFASLRRSDEEANNLVGLAKELTRLSEGDNVSEYVTTDRIFYAELGSACKNMYIEETIPRIFNLHLRLWFFISKIRGDWKNLAHAHSEMATETANAIRNKDPEGASLAIRAYVMRRQRDMRELI